MSMQVNALPSTTHLQELDEVPLSATDEKIIDLSGSIQYEVTSTLLLGKAVSRNKDNYAIAAMITGVALVIIGACVILSIHENTSAVLIGGGMAITGALIIAGTLYLMDK